ncbi:SDR family oxidoreductase [Pelagovum pacificum]|uniref:SDR family oxidoreductase n=1 Tax=Pelagovum pacificum TaxID=2588711 RepID=A0A5C5GI30_9RHOB|nr:SDR family oxidoreductase [Pelagovum pacificum]QQA43069.1 SDR family oxidoreductase [Pelagovum pacificum]TNY33787.1 SDR family oxidoreductase [Pelagovum pacificum]
MDMTGKVVLITGASRGIGAAAAEEFAAAGAKVALLARHGDKVAEIAGHIGEAALAVPCDVSRWWEVQAAIEAVADTFGRIDVLIGNAGVIEPIAPLAEADPEAWDHSIDINLKGVFHGVRAVLPVMLTQGGGTIITVSSGAAHNPVDAWSAYCSGKAGAFMLTRMADAEYREKGIRVLGLSPGTVATDMQRAIKASGANRVSKLEWSDHIPPEWPAKTLVWMCGAEADGWLGDDVSLRDEDIRRKVGLI